jgi:cysteine-rich repeat protein
MEMSRRVSGVTLLFAVIATMASPASATTIKRARTETGVDWTSAGIGGVPAGSASITVSGVTGSVKAAYLYWDGMNLGSTTSIYNNGIIQLNGHSIGGQKIGDSSSNCWGSGGTRAYFADVTSYVTGNGTYSLTGLATSPTYQVNGASLIVVFDDGDPSNDKDLIIYEGNDSTDFDKYAGVEDGGWHGLLDGVPYKGGTVRMQFHVADGQSVGGGSDSDVTLQATASDLLVLPDTVSTFDGKSVPLQGTSRSPGDALWDIETFDVSTLFSSHGTFDIAITSEPHAADCIALVVLVVENEHNVGGPGGPGGPAICGDGIVADAEECDDGNLVDGDCCSATCTAEPAGQVCGVAGDPCLEARCDGIGRCDVEGSSCRVPVASQEGRLAMLHGKRDRFVWKWTTGVSTKTDFGNPTTSTEYDLCFYDKGTGTVRLLSRMSVGAGAPWQDRRDGYLWSNPGDALQSLRLKGAAPGRATIVAKSAGGAFHLPPMPLAPPVIVRLRARNGLCWGVNFSTPKRNTASRFLSRGDIYYPGQ